MLRTTLMLLASLMLSGCAPWSAPKGPLAMLEQRLVFAPSKYPAGEWNPPSLQKEDVWFSSADGTRLHGWYCPVAEPRAAILYMHGNGGNITWLPDVVCRLQQLQVSVFVFDYRGYGQSEGRPSEQGVLDDARAARRWLAEREGLSEQQIVLFGRSLGGGVAVDLATDGARGLILQSTFTSLPDVADEHTHLVSVRGLMRNRLDSLAKISKYHGPLLISHGEADRLIPIEQGRALYDRAPGPKQFIAIPKAGHNTPHPWWYYGALDEFLNSLPR
jgi:fermentation-respiration switch protein FrsA (DUF1100 family)